MMRWNYVLVLIFLHQVVWAQAPYKTRGAKYNFSLYLGTTFSGGNIESEKERNISGGRLVSESKWSTSWPLSSESTGVSFVENLTRKFTFSINIERILNQDFSLSSGLEIGGRHFTITESIDRNPNISLVSRRGYQVIGLPLLVIHNTRINDFLYLRKTFGLVGNISNSVAKSGYYEVNNKHSFYPTLAFGLETTFKNSKGYLLAFEVMWQQGFYNILDDHITPISPLYPISTSSSSTVSNLDNYSVQSNGSHLRLGLKFYLKSFNPNHTDKSTRIPNPLIELKKRDLGKIEEIKVDTNIVRICVKDFQTIDGDIISVEWNDSLILDKENLTDELSCIEVNLKQGFPNYLVVHAINEGRIKPNTVQVTIYSGKKKKQVFVTSDLKTSGVLKLIYAMD